MGAYVVCAINLKSEVTGENENQPHGRKQSDWMVRKRTGDADNAMAAESCGRGRE